MCRHVILGMWSAGVYIPVYPGPYLYLPTHLPAPLLSRSPVCVRAKLWVGEGAFSSELTITPHTAPLRIFTIFFANFWQIFFADFCDRNLVYFSYFTILVFFLRFMPWIRHGNNNFSCQNCTNIARGQGGRGILTMHAGKNIKIIIIIVKRQNFPTARLNYRN